MIRWAERRTAAEASFNDNVRRNIFGGFFRDRENILNSAFKGPLLKYTGFHLTFTKKKGGNYNGEPTRIAPTSLLTGVLMSCLESYK
jgi:hypothetical protein